ncbi:serine/threonine-protein kinase MHK isoform X2 [Brassica rapa]|nr:serine/threonine-protein kinase MHK isoform X2 [Brassica rapa]
MERYKFLEELGDGTCGSVYKAVNLETYEVVAVKKMKRKFYYWEECMNLREVKALRKLNHPHIIKLKEIAREHNELFFIFECMDHNLYQIMKEREQRPFSEGEIRSFMSQMLQGLSHMHKNGYFHRDLKPENLLVTNNILKIADFGLAREVASMPPYTEYVSTRWYRAPEVLLQSSSYTPAVDMWAVGAILAELFAFSPLFPGESEIDQLYKICSVLGKPDWTTFPEAKSISRIMSISHTEFPQTRIADLLPNASPEAIDLITVSPCVHSSLKVSIYWFLYLLNQQRLCSWDPLKRPTADEALNHPFFNMATQASYPLHDLELRLNTMAEMPNLELNLWDFNTKQDECFLGLTLAVKPSAPKLEMVCNASQDMSENFLFCPMVNNDREPSVFWSLLSPDENRVHAPVESSCPLSLSFSPVQQHTSVGPPQQSTTGFTMGSSMQPNMLDRPWMAVSAPFQQTHYL